MSTELRQMKSMKPLTTCLPLALWLKSMMTVLSRLLERVEPEGGGEQRPAERFKSSLLLDLID